MVSLALRPQALVRRPDVWIGLGLAVMAVIVAVAYRRGPLVETTAATRQDLEQHLIASGRVRVVTRVRLAATTAGRVVAVRAAAGERVRAGAVLVELDDAEARAAVAEARAAVSQAAARLERLRQVGAVVTSEALRQAETNLARAESDLARLETLSAAGAVAQTDLDEARRLANIARAARNAARAEEVAATPDGADSRVAMSAVVESQARLASALARLDDLRIVARQDGVVLTRAVESGDTVQPGTTLLEMAADGDTELVIAPDERHMAWIRVGQRGRASADAYPQETFDAEVSYIAPAIDPARGSVEVRLRVPEPPDVLRPDMTVSVDLTVAVAQNVVTVPSDAVRGLAGSGLFVFVIEDGRLVRRPVTIGIRGEGHTEITGGLDAGITVVRGSERTLVEGQRVRTARSAG